MAISAIGYLVAACLWSIVAASLRLLMVLPRFRSRPAPRKRGSPTHLLIVLGSGGHTAEMIAMLDKAVFGPPDGTSQENLASSKSGHRSASSMPSDRLDWSNYTHRTWIISSGDSFSALRAKEFEAKVLASSSRSESTFDIISVPRARRIHQPLWTSPFSCLQCAWACATALMNKRHDFPDLIMTNGPATATVLIFTSLSLRYFDVRGCHSKGKMRTVYIESWARVKGMSLSGKLLCQVADRVLVQWEQLAGAGGRAEYHGVLCF